MPHLIVIGGPTAVGKSEVGAELALRIGGEVISADSMCLYRGMDIGTAKPVAQMKRVPHHLLDVFEPGERVDAKIYEALAESKIREVLSRGRLPILVGGSYLYIQAVLFGIEETPPPDRSLREKLYGIARKRGKEFLYRKLSAIDPMYAEKVHPNDLRRIVRALEVFLLSGRRFSSFHRWSDARYRYTGFYLKRSWESLSKRIVARVVRMLERGLVEEVRALYERGLEGFLTSSQAIGYKELVPYIKGKRSLEECLHEVIRNTKEYAKRQIRWFRRQGWTEIDLEKEEPERVLETMIAVIERAQSPLS